MSELERPPLHIILAGPQAVAGWHAANTARHEAAADQLGRDISAIRIALGIREGVTAERIAEASIAVMAAAALIEFASVGGMRGPARDQLSELMDRCFDLIDMGEQTSPEFKELVEQIRRAKR